MKKTLIAAACTLILTACGSGVEGAYSDKDGAMTWTFDGDGYVTMSTKFGGADNSATYEYKVDGDKIKLSMGGATQILPINDDGSITVMGTKLTKKD